MTFVDMICMAPLLLCWAVNAALVLLWCSGYLVIADAGNEKPRTVRCRALDNTGAWTNASDSDATADAGGALSHALAGINHARRQLNLYASNTDVPAWLVVNAAGTLDEVAAGLADAIVEGARHAYP